MKVGERAPIEMEEKLRLCDLCERTEADTQEFYFAEDDDGDDFVLCDHCAKRKDL